MNQYPPSCNRSQFALAMLIVVGYFAVLFDLIHHGFPKEGSDSLLVLLGTLTTVLSMAVGYYFGSSTGSRSKEAMIESMQNKGATTTSITTQPDSGSTVTTMTTGQPVPDAAPPVGPTVTTATTVQAGPMTQNAPVAPKAES